MAVESKAVEKKAEARSTTVRQYKVIGKVPGSSEKGIIRCIVNGERYEIKENEPTALNGAVLSFLRNAKVYKHLETGADAESAVDIAQGFERTVQAKYEVMEA